MSLITIEFFYRNKMSSPKGLLSFSPHSAEARVKGDTLFHEREYPPFDPPRERFSIAGEQLEELRRLPIALPARGAAAFSSAIRFGVLLLSAAALLILFWCSPNHLPPTTHAISIVHTAASASNAKQIQSRRKLLKTAESQAKRQRR